MEQGRRRCCKPPEPVVGVERVFALFQSVALRPVAAEPPPPASPAGSMPSQANPTRRWPPPLTRGATVAGMTILLLPHPPRPSALEPFTEAGEEEVPVEYNPQKPASWSAPRAHTPRDDAQPQRNERRPARTSSPNVGRRATTREHPRNSSGQPGTAAGAACNSAMAEAAEAAIADHLPVALHGLVYRRIRWPSCLACRLDSFMLVPESLAGSELLFSPIFKPNHPPG